MTKLTGLSPRMNVLRPGASFASDMSRRITPKAVWSSWYKLKRWKDLRETVFARDLFMCQMRGPGCVGATGQHLHCDHKVRHNGDAELFWNINNLWTLCEHCHNAWKQRFERAEGLAGVWY